MANNLLSKQLIFFFKAGLEYSMKKVCVGQNFKWGKVHLLKGVCTESQHEEKCGGGRQKRADKEKNGQINRDTPIDKILPHGRGKTGFLL